MTNKKEEDIFEVDMGGEESKPSLKTLFEHPFDHLRTGISYMLPFIMFGGILSAIAKLSYLVPDNSLLTIIGTLGDTGMAFFVPFFGAYIAYSIGNKPALAPGFVVSYCANNAGSGYLGALLAGFMVGYLVKILTTTIRPSKMFASIWQMFVPIIAGLISGLLIVGVINGPITTFTTWAAGKLSNLDPSQGAILGVILAVLDGIDFGGPISKICSAIAGAAHSQGIYTFYGIRISYVMVPPLGFMLATLIAPKLFNKGEKAYAKTGIPMTLIGGYTELALPFVFNDIIRCTVASLCGSISAGVIAGMGGQELMVPAMGLPSWFFVSNVPLYAISLAVGTIVTALVLICLKKFIPQKNFDPEADNGMTVL